MKFKYLIIAFLLPVLLISGFQAGAQVERVKNLPKYDRSPYHFGFILAGNQMLFSIETRPDFQFKKFDTQDIGGDSLYLYSVNAQPTMGFTIGIVGNLRMGNYFDLRFVPSLAFGERYLNYSILKYDEGDPMFLDVRKNVTSTFVEFPFHIKYKSKRLNNVRAYLLGGVKYTLDLASNKNKQRDNASETYIKLEKHDLMVEVGVGFDFYTSFFKFGTELKMSYGLNDVLEKDNTIYTDAIERLNSKLFLLSFTFE